MDRDEKYSSDNNPMPSMDGDNKKRLDAMYAEMDPSAISPNNLNDYDQSGCETR